MDNPLISIAIPVYDKMINGEALLKRCLDSVKEQTYTNYEIVMTHEGSMPVNTNNALRACKGELIKILYQDDYFAHKNALKDIVEAFKGQWLITGVDNNPYPYWTDNIVEGNNKLGSPSALTIKNKDVMMFDESLNYLLDCDYYQRMYEKYGVPVIVNGANVNIGIHDGQATNVLTDYEKELEFDYLKQKYEN